ncbi:hypothetical protein GX586_14340, partial [bacterium]|nr:hypothetical protein [bacterium]
MKTIPVVGRCACPAAHTRRQGVSGVLLALSILCVGLADAEEACTLSACVHPDGAGSVTIAALGDLGTGGYAMVEAVDMPPDSIFYKWTYSEGAELLDAGSQSTMVRRAEGSAATNIEVVAHFLVLHADTGTVSVRSSYKGNISGLSLIRKNRAGVKAALQAEMAGMALDKDTFVQLNAGDVSAGHVLSEDPKLKSRGASGAASFDQFSPGAAKPCGSLSLTWNAKGIQVAYMLKPPAEQNLASLYAGLYKRNGGKTFSIDSEDTGGIPLSIVMEGRDWCSVWVARGGVAYAGKARSKMLKKIGDDIVSWRVSGTGGFARYAWHAPAAVQASAQIHTVNGTRFARAAMAARQAAASARCLSAIRDSSPENMTQYPIGTSPAFNAYGPQSIQAPFYFGGRVYALSIPTKVYDQVVLTDGAIDGSGAMQISKTIGVKVGAPGVATIRSASRLTTCVFKDKVYLFFDTPVAGTTFNIYACRSSKPEVEWENIGFLPFKGAHTYENGFMHTGLKAVVFNGRIYLITGTGDGRFTIHSSPDGEQWQLVAWLDDAASWGDKYRSEMSACVVTRNAQPMLCIAVLGTDNRPQWMYLRYFNVENRMAGGYHYYLDWVSSAHGIGIASGTVRGSAAGQVVQIFAHSSSWELYTHVRACTIDVESHNFQGWWNVPVKVQRPRLMYCDAVESVIPVPQRTNEMRKCISFFTDIENGQVGIPVYQSDLIRP